MNRSAIMSSGYGSASLLTVLTKVDASGPEKGSEHSGYARARALLRRGSQELADRLEDEALPPRRRRASDADAGGGGGGAVNSWPQSSSASNGRQQQQQQQRGRRSSTEAPTTLVSSRRRSSSCCSRVSSSRGNNSRRGSLLDPDGDNSSSENVAAAAPPLCSKCGGSSEEESFSNDTYPVRKACTISLDLGKAPPSADATRHHQDLRRKARSLLEEAYDKDVARYDASDYVVLPTAAGLAIVVFRPAQGHASCEYTALWFGARMITWAKFARRSGTLRGGIASGQFETVQDVYGMPVVIGPSIGIAMRVLDCALPGQVLACADSVVPELELEINIRAEKARDAPDRKYALSYRIDEELHEVIAGNDNCTASVQTVTGSITALYRDDNHNRGGEEGTPKNLPFGNRNDPINKWYLRLKPTELEYDSVKGTTKAKVPPTELLLRHKRVAFVGVTHSQIVNVFRKALESDPTKTWSRIYFLFLSDERLDWIAENRGDNDQPVEALIAAKQTALAALGQLLAGRVGDLRFLEYDKPFYCASYWDWDERGGFVHVSPLVWGADPRTCPAMNYHWIGTDAGDDYVAYQDGLTSLLQTSQRVHPSCAGDDVLGCAVVANKEDQDKQGASVNEGYKEAGTEEPAAAVVTG